jgi:hypothetical protein
LKTVPSGQIKYLWRSRDFADTNTLKSLALRGVCAMNRPFHMIRIKSHGMVFLLLILSVFVIASCSAQLQQFNESLQHQPVMEYEYTLNSRKYFFATGMTTYQEVIRQVGTPDLLNLTTTLGENRDGTKFIVYRTINDDPAHTFKQYGSSVEAEKSPNRDPNTVQITDVKFLFNKEEILVSADLQDKSNDREAIAEFQRRSHETGKKK